MAKRSSPRKPTFREHGDLVDVSRNTFEHTKSLLNAIATGRADVEAMRQAMSDFIAEVAAKDMGQRHRAWLSKTMLVHFGPFFNTDTHEEVAAG